MAGTPAGDAVPRRVDPAEWHAPPARARIAADPAGSAPADDGFGLAVDPLLRQLFGSHPLPMLMYAPDSLAIVDVNDALVGASGYARAELLAMSIADLHPPDEVAALVAAIQRLNHGRRPAHRTATRWQHVYRDGSIHDVEVAAHDLDMQGRMSVLVVITDITERLRAERERDELLARMRAESAERAAILEQMADAVVVADARGVVVLANHAAHDMFDIDGASWPLPTEPMSRTTLFDPEGQPVLDADRPFRRSLTGETVRGEFRIVTRKDRERWVDIASGPLRDDQGAVTGAVWIGRDITDERRRRAREAQGDKLRALGQMASGVAHDLNQYLGLVAGYGDLSARSLDVTPPDLAGAREAIDVVVRAAMDGSDTVKRLLTFARPTPDGPADVVDVGSLLREVAALTAPRLRDETQQTRRPITMTVEVNGDTLITGWASALREALTNLIFNAIDAMPAGGTIRLEAAPSPEGVAITVSDSGVGIPESALQHVFEPFFTTKGERGTGLGLAIVYGIVERHGGSLTIASPPGHGTTVTVTLPAATGQKPPPLPRARQAEPGGLRILVVDDEPSITRMVSMMLVPHGHTIITAASAEEALDKLAAAAQPFDLILSDLGLGAGMNGWDLLDHVREIAPGTRFILSTGWGAQIDPATVIERGGEGLLPKPYRLNGLLTAIAGPA
ncbi:MAG: PAS domain S-box protein [Chloroflexi bacterium]|nr:PAS domain S-box protein [Chloroflexota bacterium]